MSISTPFIKRRIGTSLVMAAIVLVGLAAFPLLPIAVYALGILALGLIDDTLAGDEQRLRARGWRGHGSAVLRGELTTGTLKAAGSLGLALLATSYLELSNGRWLLAPAYAKSPDVWLRAIGPACAILVLHYLWVLRADSAFQTAAVEASARRAATRRDRRRRSSRRRA